ncbi:MAG: hypothetical protein AB7L91_15460 [Dehalococcoidia bacterium]
MPMNIYLSPALERRMKAVDASSAEAGLGKIKWSSIAQAAFERECLRRESSASGLPSVESVDVAAIADRARRGVDDSYRIAFGVALEMAESMDEEDIYFLGEYDDSADRFEAVTGLSFIDPDHGYPRSQFQLWADDQAARLSHLLRPAVDAARDHAAAEGLRFHPDQATRAAMDAFEGVSAQLQRHVSDSQTD